MDGRELVGAENVCRLALGDEPNSGGGDDLFASLRGGELEVAFLSTGVNEHVVDDERVGAAPVGESGPLLAAARKGRNLLAAVAQIDMGRRPARRHEQAAGRGEQVALGGNIDLLFPDGLAGGGIEGAQPGALGWEQAGGEVGRLAIDQHAAADRPEGDHPAVARQPPIRFDGPVLPDERTVRGFEAVDAAVVGAEIDLARVDRRREADGSFRDVGPKWLTAGRIKAAHGVVGRRSVVEPPLGDHRLEGAIEGDRGAQPVDFPINVLFRRTFGPRRPRRVGGRMAPAFDQGQRERVGGDVGPPDVASGGRPIGGRRGRRKGRTAHGGSEQREGASADEKLHGSRFLGMQLDDHFSTVNGACWISLRPDLGSGRGRGWATPLASTVRQHNSYFPGSGAVIRTAQWAIA